METAIAQIFGSQIKFIISATKFAIGKRRKKSCCIKNFLIKKAMSAIKGLMILSSLACPQNLLVGKKQENLVTGRIRVKALCLIILMFLQITLLWGVAAIIRGLRAQKSLSISAMNKSTLAANLGFL